MERLFHFYSKPIPSVEGQTTPKIPRVSVVGRIREGFLEIAVSRCSIKENFIFRKGRAIAEGRLRKGKLYEMIPMEDISPKEFVALASKIAEDVVESKIVHV